MIGVLLNGIGEEDTWAGSGVSTNVTEEGISCFRVERNLTKILRCWVESSW